MCAHILLHMCPHIHTSLHFEENRLLYMCPHCTTYVSWCRYICVPIRLYLCPHTSLHFVENGLLLYMCPHATTCVSSYLLSSCCAPISVLRSTYYYICVLMYYICVLILTYVSSCYYMCPRTSCDPRTTNYTCVLMLLQIWALVLYPSVCVSLSYY